MISLLLKMQMRILRSTTSLREHSNLFLNLWKKPKNEIDALRSIFNSLEISENEEDLSEIREELHSLGYIKKNSKEKLSKTPKPMHYISSDGFDIYVGKNNYQNEYVTFKLADPNDWWFHCKRYAWFTCNRKDK